MRIDRSALSLGASALIAFVLIFVVLIFFVVPTQGAEVKGGLYAPNGKIGYVHYERSLSCALVPLGLYYWDGAMALGCSGPVLPEILSANSCIVNYSNGTGPGELLYLSQESGSTASLCVKYYYYNSTGMTTIHTLDQLTIYESVQSSGTLKNVNSSFSVVASAAEIQIGGPNVENEGFLVTYTIESLGLAPSGTYEIDLSSGLYPEDIICP